MRAPLEPPNGELFAPGSRQTRQKRLLPESKYVHLTKILEGASCRYGLRSCALSLFRF